MKSFYQEFSSFSRLRPTSWDGVRGVKHAFSIGGLVGSGGNCGCCSTASSCSISYSVNGCNLVGISGASIGIYTNSTLSSLVQSALTDSAGHAVLTLVSSMSGFQKITASNYNANSGSTTFTCPQGRSVNLTAATGYVCFACCNSPVSTANLHLTDNGSATLTYNSVNNFWDGCGSVSGVTTMVFSATPQCNIQTGTVFPYYRISCDSGVNPKKWFLQEWHVQISDGHGGFVYTDYNGCTLANNCSGTTFTGIFCSNVHFLPSPCDSMSASVTLVNTGSCAINPPGGFSVSISY